MNIVTEFIIALLQTCVDKPNPVKFEFYSPQNLRFFCPCELAHKRVENERILQADAVAEAQCALAHGDRIQTFSSIQLSTHIPRPEPLRQQKRMVPLCTCHKIRYLTTIIKAVNPVSENCHYLSINLHFLFEKTKPKRRKKAAVHQFNQKPRSSHPPLPPTIIFSRAQFIQNNAKLVQNSHNLAARPTSSTAFQFWG